MTKQKKKEHLPLSVKAIDVLQILKKRAAKGSIYVFPGYIEGQPLKEIKTFWKTLLKQAKLENVRIHDLRHSYLSLLARKGASLSMIQMIAGHSDARTTTRYIHMSSTTLGEVANLASVIVPKQPEALPPAPTEAAPSQPEVGAEPGKQKPTAQIIEFSKAT